MAKIKQIVNCKHCKTKLIEGTKKFCLHKKCYEEITKLKTSPRGKKTGIYETTYGNACEYLEGAFLAYDIDAAEVIPVEMVNFDKFIREE